MKNFFIENFFSTFPLFSPKTSVYQPRYVQNKKLIYIRIPLIISSLLIYNKTFWLLFYLAKFPKFRIFSNFSIRTRISAPRYSPIEFIFTCACSPVSSDYILKKIFSKFFTIRISHGRICIYSLRHVTTFQGKVGKFFAYYFWKPYSFSNLNIYHLY